MLTSFPDLPDDIRLHLQVQSGDVDRNWPTILSEGEVQRRQAMNHPGRKSGFTLGRVALRTLLASRLDVLPQNVPLVVEASGQLAVPGSGLHISLAHSGNQAIAVLATRPVGIDLEEVRPKPKELLDYILSGEEKEHIYSLKIADSHRLFLCWTLKEAVLKAKGVGLRHSPRSILLEIDESTRTAIMVDTDGKKWSGRYCLDGTWVSAIAF